jgi:hypothetical protein
MAAARGVATSTKIFHGLYQSSYGLLRLQRDGDAVSGSYPYGAGGIIEGTVEGDTLTFSYREPVAKGEGWFRATDFGFFGKWRAAGRSEWSDWSGTCAAPQPGVKWLVILEALWEDGLCTPEYAWGDMLRAYFQRHPHTHVRHRRVYGRADLIRGLNEVRYLAEPTVVIVASHGRAGRLCIAGAEFNAAELAEQLKSSPHVFLLHFSACAMLVDDALPALQDLVREQPLTISGYGTKVDWAGSAVLEFLYLDLVLGRGRTPADAYKAVHQELRFAGESAPGSLVGATHFRIAAP